MQKPSQEEFDAMNDAEFDAWWTDFAMFAQAKAQTEVEVNDVHAQWEAASAARMS